MLKFDANLYRIAMACSSKEEARYYLQGAFIEPHAIAGVTITTTDGHRLISIHDENGSADESAIIKLSPEAMKACKPGKNEARRVVAVDGADATVSAVDQYAEITPITFSKNCRIDGVYPDYRRVVPQHVIVQAAGESPAVFSGVYLSAFGDIAVELEKHFDRLNKAAAGVTQILGDDNEKPHLIVFDKVSEAFGVLMPIRSTREKPLFRVPAWFTATDAAPSIETPAETEAAAA